MAKPSANPHPADLIERGRQRERAGDLQAAADLYRRAAEMTDGAILWLLLASALRERGEFEAAADACDHAIAAGDCPHLSYRQLGRVRDEQGELRDAEDAFRRSVDERANPTTLTFLGHLLRRQDRDAEAKECFEQALALESDYEEAHLNLGLLAEIVDREAAIEHYRKAIGIDPDYAAAHAQLGFCLSAKPSGREQGEVHCRRSIELDPTQPGPHAYLADILTRRGAADEAEKEYLIAIRLNPDTHVFHADLAAFYKGVGTIRRGGAALRKGDRARPNRRRQLSRLRRLPCRAEPYGRCAHVLAGWTLTRAGRPEAARSVRRTCGVTGMHEPERKLFTREPVG